jgi:alkaline phosphatase D
MNNGGSQYKDRAASQKIFLDFVDEPQDSLRRQRPGIYTSYFLPGDKSDKDVQLILLDVRYHKSTTIGQGDFLGEEQWAWLESILKDSPSRIHLIGSGIQVTPFQKPVQEAWSLYPESRQRLFDLLSKHRVPGVILLSGDVHYSEVLRVPTECSGTGYPVHEFTSSGMTHTCDGMLGNCKLLLDALFKTPYHYPNSFFTKLNWGSIRFDWTKETVTLQTHNVTGAVVNEVSIFIPDIQPPTGFIPPSPGAISRCDGEPNSFLLIPFENYKYVLYLVPLSVIYSFYLFFKHLILPAFQRLRTRNENLKIKLGKTE